MIKLLSKVSSFQGPPYHQKTSYVDEGNIIGIPTQKHTEQDKRAPREPFTEPMDRFDPPFDSLMSSICIEIMEEMIEGKLRPFIEGEQIGRYKDIKRKPPKSLSREYQKHKHEHARSARALIADPLVPEWMREDLRKRAHV